MNELFNPGLSMTSMDIAELVSARHDSVKRAIERLAEKSAISLPPLVEVKVDRARREEITSVYVFTAHDGKRDSIVVVAQLSPEFTARLVDRWAELEAGLVPQDFEHALRLAADQQRRLKEQQRLLVEQAPKVALADAVIADASLHNLREAGKLVDLGGDRVFKVLQGWGWIYRREQFDAVKRDNPWLPTVSQERAGTLVLKYRPDHLGITRPQTMVTRKGIAAIRAKLEQLV